MAGIIIGEIVEVQVGGMWYEAKVLDTVDGESAYVYIYDLRRKANARAEDIRTDE